MTTIKENMIALLREATWISRLATVAMVFGEE